MKIINKIVDWFNKVFNFKPEVTEEELSAIEICRKLITKDNVLMFISPISHKRYIKDDVNGMFVIIDNQTINIMNHVYSYTITIYDIRIVEELNKDFDLELEKRRIELEDEVKLNIQHSLKNILKDIDYDE